MFHYGLFNQSRNRRSGNSVIWQTINSLAPSCQRYLLNSQKFVNSFKNTSKRQYKGLHPLLIQKRYLNSNVNEKLTLHDVICSRKSD